MDQIAEIVKKLGIGRTTGLTFDEETYCRMKCDALNAETGNLVERDGYNCSLCKNRGFIAEPEQDDRGIWRERIKYCKCQKSRRALRRLSRSGLKDIVQTYTFDRYEVTSDWQRAIKTAAERFVEDDEHTCWFIGGASGCGKTHICTAMAGWYLKHGREVRYMLWRDEIVRLKASVTDAETYDRLMGDLKRAAVLYIDDLFKTGRGPDGPQKPTQADINIAFELINARYNNRKLVTIISSECMIADILDIDEAIGGRLVERAVHNGYGFNVRPGEGKNYRLREAGNL